MTLDEFRDTIQQTPLLTLADLIDAIASELRTRDLGILATWFRHDAEMVRNYHGLRGSTSIGTRYVRDRDSGPRVGVGDEGLA